MLFIGDVMLIISVRNQVLHSKFLESNGLKSTKESTYGVPNLAVPNLAVLILRKMIRSILKITFFSNNLMIEKARSLNLSPLCTPCNNLVCDH